MQKPARLAIAIALGACTQLGVAGPLDPDCTPEKAAKSAATKAAVGVGGRCDAKEAASDTAKRTAGVEDKGPLDKRNDDTVKDKAKNKAKNPQN